MSIFFTKIEIRDEQYRIEEKNHDDGGSVVSRDAFVVLWSILFETLGTDWSS